jgi:CDP-diacylglycerol--serine O-phosphatidyltransferase
MKATRQRFSMLRTFALADVLTLANGFCGAGSILALMQHIATGVRGWLWVAIVLLPVALFFDFADGRVARWRHRSSPLGADLDSLADVISFGMAPAALGFAVGLRSSLDVAVLLYFVACGISRLARFNVTAATMSDESGKVSHFEGTPIPTSVLIVGMWAYLVSIDRTGASMLFGAWDWGPVALHPLSLIYFLSGSLMISTFRIPKL